MTWNRLTDRGNAAQHVRWDIVPFTLGRGLDLGCGQYKPFRHFIGIDSNKDATLFGIPAIVATVVYIVDVRPKVAEVSRGPRY